jgi:hypothetical protein
VKELAPGEFVEEIELNILLFLVDFLGRKFKEYQCGTERPWVKRVLQVFNGGFGR